MSGPSEENDTSPEVLGLPSLDEDVELFVGGVLSAPLPVFVRQLMSKLAAVGLSVDSRREAGELTYPPGYESGDVREVRLQNGQILWLALDAYRENPFDDERWYGRVEVRGMMARTDRAILATVSEFEGSKLSRAGRTCHNPEPSLERIRDYLKDEEVFGERRKTTA